MATVRTRVATAVHPDAPRVQWAPERNLHLQPLPCPSPQLGLEAVRRYANEWTVAISDVTPLAHEAHAVGLGIVSAIAVARRSRSRSQRLGPPTDLGCPDQCCNEGDKIAQIA
ncbi:DUF4291 family protein [Streptomyces sp. NBC_00564]|uniref:DUF4291 family protein n=1 Tax=Streptomyces sp. NBC_00564 TaxID=2903663 RepID=UPI00352EFF1F